MAKPNVSRQKVVVDYIFRPWITKKDGTRVYASQYGKRAFRIPVYGPVKN